MRTASYITFFLIFNVAVLSQTMTIHLKKGGKVEYKLSEIEKITYTPGAPVIEGPFWIFYITTIIILLLFGLSYRYLFARFGNDVAIIWVGLILVLVTTFTVGIWKFAQIEKVDTDATTTPDSST